MTKYAEHIDSNTWGSGCKIIPMNYADAAKWAEEHLSAYEYQNEFGAVQEEDDVSIHVKIPASADAKLRTEASKRGISITALVLDMIEKL